LLIYWSGSSHIDSNVQYTVYNLDNFKFEIHSITCYNLIKINKDIADIAKSLENAVNDSKFNALGGKTKKNSYVSYNGHRYRVHRGKMGKYILYKKEALYLKGIKGCYKTLACNKTLAKKQSAI
jgi:hypothetical protein